MKKITGAEALLKSLEKEGVDIIFGIPGGVLIPIYDALFKQDKIKHILMRHEQSAAHAADGYARATGKVGVCMATSGPGATNLVTGIANAYMDSVPMVALTGQVVTSVLGTDAFQEADITGITLPIVKHSYLIKDVNELPIVIKEAFHIASTGRPGPVLIDIPKDVTTAMIDFKYPDKLELPGYKPTYKGHPKQVKQAAKAIMDSKRPVIYAGGGIIASNASDELVGLAEMAGIPVTTTLMGIGMIPTDNKLALGMLGMHGTQYANKAIIENDLIIALGVRFDDRVTGKLSKFAEGIKVIHVDIDPAEIGKNIAAMIPVVGNAKDVLAALATQITKLREQGAKEESKKAWLAQIAKWKKDLPLSYKIAEGSLNPQFVVEEISRLTGKKDTIVTTGVGQNQMWAAQYYNARKPRSFISSGGLGTMGFGLPSAIGAKFGRPDSTVWVIDGDGSFQMVSQELATATVNNLSINIAILNNGYLGMVRQWQQLFFEKNYSETCLRFDETCPPGCSKPIDDCPKYVPDFVKLAEAYSAKGIRVCTRDEVEPAIKEAMKTKGPTLIDFCVNREENVFPMVPAGASLHEIIASEEDLG